jgi:hypothetical protein
MSKSLLSAAVWAVALGSTFLIAAPAGAAIIPASSQVAASPAIAGTGLSGAYWNTNTSMASNAAADAVTLKKPTATFLATTVDYTSTHTLSGTRVPDTETLASFLGANASGLSGAGRNTLDTSVYLFSGYLNVTSAMDNTPGTGTIDMTFQVGSDDGMRLAIGGTTVTAFDAPRPYAYSSGSASFAAAGLYPIALLFWENYGNTGVDLAWKVAGNSDWQDVPTADLYASVPAFRPSFLPDSMAADTAVPVVADMPADLAADGHVPEPGSLALIGLGALAAVGARSRRARC